jgi:hypothetical protein
MLQIKYKNEFLDIVPGQETELEKNSPLFLLDNLLAEYSTPVNFIESDTNARLLGQIYFDKTIRKKTKIEVEIYSYGTFRSNATLVLNSAGINFMIAGKSTAGGYLLTGVSNFFTAIKDKKLSDLQLGGDRVMNFTSFNPVDGSGGYWQHFQSTWLFNDDYVVLPVINEAIDDSLQQYRSPQWFNFLAGNKASGWMNMIDGNNLFTQQPVFPFPKIEYVLNQLFLENGWKLDTSGLNDTEWSRMLLFSAYYVHTTTFDVVYHPLRPRDVDLIPIPNAQVTINLSRCMPKDVTCSSFLFALCKRYGWFPVCNSNTRTCTLIALKEIGNKPTKDWTKYKASVMQSAFNSEARTFAFKNTFGGNDAYPGSAPDLSQYDRTPPVYSQRNLIPLINSTFDNTVVFAFLENRYFHVIYDDTVHDRVWSVLSDNIYDEDPGNATDSFETECAPLPISYSNYSGNYYGLFSICNQNVFDAWGIRTIIYHGMVKQVDANGNAGPADYPYGSCTHISPAGDSVLAWSNVYKHYYSGVDHGLINYWWSKWMKMNSSNENEVKITFNLPLHELDNFRWDEIILVHNVPYLVKSYIEPLNYKGSILATLQRVALS